jgi:hypothetical protein
VYAIDIIGNMNWYDAYSQCDNLVVDGYDDWYLPSINDFLTIYSLGQIAENSGVLGHWYWTSNEYSYNNVDDSAFRILLYSSSVGFEPLYDHWYKTFSGTSVRPIRGF